MSTHSKVLLSLAGLSLFLATIGGAVASHVLTGLDASALHSFETAVDFQFFHALGLIGMVLARARGIAGTLSRIAAWLLVAGTVLFCGSIYAVTFGAPRGLLSAAPYGGVALMLGWLAFVAGIWQTPRADGKGSRYL